MKEFGTSSIISIGGDKTSGFLGRKPFRSNHVTNTVFLLSIWQSTMITLVNHAGSPFTGRILENRSFCLSICMSLLFCFITATEVFPSVNKLLELAPITRIGKFNLVFLFFMDFLGTFVVNELSTYLFDRELWDVSKSECRNKLVIKTAVDEEEALLAEEWALNRDLVMTIGFCMIILVIKGIIYP